MNEIWLDFNPLQLCLVLIVESAVLTPSSLLLQGWTHTEEINRCRCFPLQSRLIALSRDSTSQLTSHIRQWKTWERALKGPDVGDGTTGPGCVGLRWMSRDSEGCGWCMIVCERGDRGGRPRNSPFQSLSVDMTPLPAVLERPRRTPSFLFLLPNSLFLSDSVPGSLGEFRPDKMTSFPSWKKPASRAHLPNTLAPSYILDWNLNCCIVEEEEVIQPP